MKKDSIVENQKFISYAYAIGAIFVVLGHSTPTSASDAPNIVDTIRTFIYFFHMPLFFFIAGFLFKYTTQKRKKPYRKFVKEKCIKFLVPYFVLSTLFLFPKILLSEFVNDKSGFDIHYIIKEIFSPRDNVWGHFWFLPTLLLIYMMSYVLLNIYNYRVIFAFVLIITLGLAVFPINTNWFAIKDICYQLVYFCIGFCLSDFIAKNKSKIFKWYFVFVTLIFSVLIYIVFLNVQLKYSEIAKNICAIIVAFLMIYVVLGISYYFEVRGSKLLDFFDGKTFTIYLMSWPTQAAVEILFNRMLHLHWYIVIAAMITVGFCVPLLFIEIYKRFKYHPKIVNLIFGIKF